MGLFGKSLKKQLIDLALLKLKEGDQKNFDLYLNVNSYFYTLLISIIPLISFFGLIIITIFSRENPSAV